ncbi:phage holin family protein [Gardnerella sp. DNF00622A]|uniref:phage holin family protein n=1 Tax=Gardnerella sp. DNF00622A TaxID=2749053 RepID=UPI003BAF3737
MNDIEIYFLEIAGGVVLFDFISGFAKALYTHSVASSKMRDGLFHKFAYVLVVAICILFDYAQAKVNLGTHVPLVLIACGYIILTDTVSFFENLTAFNLQIANMRVVKVILSVLACVKNYIDGQADDAINNGKHAALTEADIELDGRGKPTDVTPTENK